MEAKSIDVQILESNRDFVKVKLPFFEIPVEMNYHFFTPRVEKGYFKIMDSTEHQLGLRLDSQAVASRGNELV